MAAGVLIAATALTGSAVAASSDLVSGRLWWGFDTATTSDPGGQTLLSGGTATTWMTPAAANQTPFGEVFDASLGKLFWIEQAGSGDVLIRGADATGSNPTTLATITGSGDPDQGLTYDPATRTLYWIATDASSNFSIWKSTVTADGTSAEVPTAPWYDLSSINSYAPQGPTVDPLEGRIYWASEVARGLGGGADNRTIFYARLDGTSTSFPSLNATGGACTGDPVVESAESIAIDHAAKKLYIGGSTYLAPPTKSMIVRTDLDGGNCEMLLTLAPSEMRGLAVDPSAKRLYASSHNTDEVLYVDLTTPSTNGVVQATPVGAKPNSLFLAMAPSGTATVTPATGAPGTKLTCTPTWAPSEPSLFLARAAASTAYAWSVDGAPLTDTTAQITATRAGTYTCVATGTNAIGAATPSATAKITDTATAMTPRLRIISGRVVNGTTLVARVRASTAGTVRVTATLVGARACVATAKVTRGVRVLQCPLYASARRAVATRPTAFRVVGRLTTATKQVATARTIVRARQYAVPVTG